MGEQLYLDSNVKYCDLKDFFRAQFVNFMCQKYVKKGYMEMGEQLYLDSNVKYCDLKDFFKGSICNFLDVKICKKMVHGSGGTTLPCALKKCPRSLYFTLLLMQCFLPF